MRKRGLAMRDLFLVSLFLCLPCAGAELPVGDDATAIIRDVVATYRGLSSYQDVGVSIQTLRSSPRDPDTSRTTVRFSTLFDRDGPYSFSWTAIDNFSGEQEMESINSCFWSDGSKSWYREQFYGEKPDVKETSLQDASAASTGISHGTSHDIFRLLTNKVNGFRFDQLRNLHVTRSEVVSRIDSYVVHGIYPYADVKDTVDLWVGKKDHLIHKLVETNPDSNTNTVERTGIVVNGKIPDAEFTSCAKLK
jgi:hypothetical protein